MTTPNILDGMGDLSKRTGGNGASRGNATQSMNLLFRVKEVSAVSANEPTPLKDTAVVVLLVDAFGKKADSEVTIRMRDRGQPKDPKKTPMEIWNLQPGKRYKKGSGEPCGEWPAVVGEDAKVLTDGTIELGWIKVIQHEYVENPTSEAVMIGLISTQQLEVPGDRNNVKFPRQNRDYHMPDQAVMLGAVNDNDAITAFRAQAISFLTPHPDKGGGKPRAIVRLVNTAAIGQEGYLGSATIAERWVEGTKQTPEQSVDMWLSDEANAGWLNYISLADQVVASGGIIEMWPAWRYDAGKQLTDNEVETKGKGRFTTDEAFSAPKLLDDGSLDGTKRQWGLVAEGVHQLVLLPTPKGDEWKVNVSYTSEKFPSKLFAYDELVTANCTEEMAKHFTDRATQRVAERVAAIRASKGNTAQAPARGQAPAQDFGGEGAPDPTAGFRPR